MAAIGVPPRILKKNDSLTKSTKSGQNSLEILKQMGFPENRALKALAATGDKGVQMASDWLLSHVNDMSIDEKSDREYILYLCPVGGLQAELNAFWEKSRHLCGWNGAHAYFPHITLCPFFKVEDRKVSMLCEAFSKLENSLKNLPRKLTLQFFSQQNFVGLFMVYEFFKELLLNFAADIKKLGIEMEPPKKQFHITCAYQYKPEHHDTLTKLAKEINLGIDSRWDLRLYSRDPQLGHCEVRKVLRPYHQKLQDELELVSGDFMIMETSELSRSNDGWYSGMSWVSGIHGMFPGSFTKRTAETWTWTLLKSLPISFKQSEQNDVNGEYGSLWESQEAPLYAKVNKDMKLKSPRYLFVMRHGERVDFVMGRDWTEKNFDEDGKYHRDNLNMPQTMYKRPSHLEYIKDSPLTQIGKHQARITGSAFAEEKVAISQIFVSPALRCVETAQAFLEGFGSDMQLCIEPSLFEWLGWYHPMVPMWFPPEELSKNGFAIDTLYCPFLQVKDLNIDETVEECYHRGANFSRFVVKRFSPERGNILFIGHAGSLDICTRQLCELEVRNKSEFHQHLSSIPYCGVCMIQEDPSSGTWAMKDPPIKPFTHGTNKSFSWKILLQNQNHY